LFCHQLWWIVFHDVPNTAANNNNVSYPDAQVSTSKMGIIYGIIGMSCLIAGFWADSAYTYDEGVWLIAASMAPGIVFGIWTAMSVEFTGLPELVGAYNGFGGLAAALEGIGLYLGEFWCPLSR
jgi:NAD/NADP transhydrogenase beta subunit